MSVSFDVRMRLRLVPAFLKTIRRFTNDSESILDIGCGCLYDSFKKQFGARYTGLDTEDSEWPRDVTGDAHDLKFADDSFDVVTAWSVIEHLLCPYAGIMEMVRVSRRVVLLNTDFTRQDQDGDPTHLYCWTPKILRQLLARTGYPYEVRISPTFPRFLGLIWKKGK